MIVAQDGAALDDLLGKGARPDLFVLDVGLPGENGFEIARVLRNSIDPDHHPHRRR